eukprot:1151441-Pelagomonas_calceolata.AAC.2
MVANNLLKLSTHPASMYTQKLPSQKQPSEVATAGGDAVDRTWKLIIEALHLVGHFTEGD